MSDSHAVQTRRRWLLGAGAVAAVAGAGVGVWRMTPNAVPDAASAAVWRQAFETPDGQSLNLATWSGKPLLLNFWATWCPPCVEELPMLDAFWRENATNGGQVVALAIDQPSAVRRFLEKHSLGFPIGLAGLGGTELTKLLGNSSGGLPFTVFFNANGSIWRQKLGQLTPEDLSAWRVAARSA